MFYNLRIYYYISRYLNELKSISEERFEAMKDFRLKAGFYEENLRNAFELAKKAQLKRHNKITLTYEIYLDYFYKDDDFKSMIMNKYGMETYKLHLRAGGFDEKPSEAINSDKLKEDATLQSYAKEIQKHLFDLGCSFTTAGYVSAMALKHDRSALDQAISFCVGAIAENYCQLEDLTRLTMNGNIHLMTTSNMIKNYHENGQISKYVYQSVISILGSCLNRNKTSEEQEVLESLINQNYIGTEKLVSIK